jgi:DNA-binding transcriptional MerR regulator
MALGKLLFQVYYAKTRKMQYFNIQVASQLSGVASATIRAWEKRYKAVVPERGDNRHRLYSEKDIEKLALLYRLTEVGQSIGKIAHLSLEELKEVYSSLLHRPYDETMVVTPHHERIDFDKILGNLLIALRAYKLDIISHELQKTKTLLRPQEYCLNILVPLFREVRKKVSHGELSVAQENSLRSIVSFHVGELVAQHYQKSQAGEGLILISASETEATTELLLSALLFIHFGCRFLFMEGPLPAGSLVEAANSLNAKIVLLAAVPSLVKDLNQIAGNLKKTEIWVSGELSAADRTELEKKKISSFPSLESLNRRLEISYSH